MIDDSKMYSVLFCCITTTGYMNAIETGQILGSGVYGSVEVVIINKVRYAAKIFHQHLRDSKQFIKEFKVLSQLKHDKIMCYIGLVKLHRFGKELPAVVMEVMQVDLHRRILLQSPLYQAPLSFREKVIILQDMSSGLEYLHRNEIVHRDLTARNVLLNSSGVAKISDIGNSRIVPMEQMLTMTCIPEAVVYMAPEATSKQCDEKVDSFSFGHLSLFIFIDEFPRFLLPLTYESGRKLYARSEVERRENYLKKIQTFTNNTAILSYIKRCLEVEPTMRPSASQLYTILTTLRKRATLSLQTTDIKSQTGLLTVITYELL